MSEAPERLTVACNDGVPDVLEWFGADTFPATEYVRADLVTKDLQAGTATMARASERIEALERERDEARAALSEVASIVQNNHDKDVRELAGMILRTQRAIAATEVRQ